MRLILSLISMRMFILSLLTLMDTYHFQLAAIQLGVLEGGQGQSVMDGKIVASALVPSKSDTRNGCPRTRARLRLAARFPRRCLRDVLWLYTCLIGMLTSDQVLSFCNAQSLAVNPHFNRQIPIERGEVPTIKTLTSSPVHTAGVTSASVRIRARDPNGLHQAMLFARTNTSAFCRRIR